MDRFWGGLTHDIQEILIHEECYPMDHLFRLACKAEQEIKRRVPTRRTSARCTFQELIQLFLQLLGIL